MGLMRHSTSEMQVMVSFSIIGDSQLTAFNVLSYLIFNSIDFWKLAQISQPQMSSGRDRVRAVSALHPLHSCFYRFSLHLTVWLIGALYDFSNYRAQNFQGFDILLYINTV